MSDSFNTHSDPSILFRDLSSDSGETYLSLSDANKQLRSILVYCMPIAHHWGDAAYEEYKSVIHKLFHRDKEFFKELLTNGDNDSSPLIFAHVSVQTDEELLFLAMRADKLFGNMASAFSVFASEDQKKDPVILSKLFAAYPEAKEYLQNPYNNY